MGPPVSGSSAMGKACAACLTRGGRDVEQCPRLVAIALGRGDDIKKANAFSNKLSLIKQLDTNAHRWANTEGRPWIPIADTQISRIRSDGHCLFAAIDCSRFRSLGRDLPAAVGDIGPRARALWIRSARKILLEGDGTASGPTSGINARDIYWTVGRRRRSTWR